jgi:hypothetical protein
MAQVEAKVGGSRRRTVLPLVVFLVAGAAALVPGTHPARGADADLRLFVEALADPAMAGRGIGTAEHDRARDLIVEALAEAGAAPGGAGGEWLQPFEDEDGRAGANVIGRVGGENPEWILIGAHYDGLGTAEIDGEDQVHPGADDNAAGVGALVRAAERIAAVGPLGRTVYVVAFSGEETGLGGSKALVADPPQPLERCLAMINLDTVGRLEENRLIVFGTGTAQEWKDVLQGVNHGFRFDLVLNDGSGSASDHASFVSRGVPSLHLFTGAKPEYHRPGDVVDLLNWDGLERIADFVAETAIYLADSGLPLTFRPEGVDRLAQEPGQRTTKRRVSFGSIPDFSRESGGILLSGVMPGGPAEAAGLEKGDLVTAIDGTPLDTLADFQAVLASHEPGDKLKVTYERAGEKREVELVLAERKR